LAAILPIEGEVVGGQLKKWAVCRVEVVALQCWSVGVDRKGEGFY